MIEKIKEYVSTRIAITSKPIKTFSSKFDTAINLKPKYKLCQNFILVSFELTEKKNCRSASWSGCTCSCSLSHTEKLNSFRDIALCESTI